MLLFPILLASGLVGLAAMWAAGLSHGRHGHGHHALGHKAHGRLPARAPSARAALAKAPSSKMMRAPQTAAQGRNDAPLAVAEHEDARAAWLGRLLTLLSPITWCGLLIGAGAAGTIAVALGAALATTWVAAAAGAMVFQFGVLAPMSRTVFAFASRPAGNLEGCLYQEVRAVTRFNPKGEGLVRVTIDGRTEDVLAVLTEEEKSRPGRVERGDRLVIEEVHSKFNRCLVSRAA